MMRSALHYHLCVEHESHGMVELHWKTDPDFPIERGEDRGWWASLPWMDLMGGRVRTFAEPDLLLVLALHGSKHHWTSLAWLVDLAEMVRRCRDADWQALLERAARERCERRLALGLLLAARWLDAPLPHGLVKRLEERADLDALAARAAASFFEPSAAGRGALEALRFDLDLHDTRARRLRHVAAHLASPNISDWSRWRLPAALSFLYPPLRLMRLSAKYLRR